MVDPLEHEAFLGLQSALEDAQEKNMATNAQLAAQLQKVHESMGELSRIMDVEQGNCAARWDTAEEKFKQFKKALSTGLGIGADHRERIEELEKTLEERARALGGTEEQLAALQLDHGEQLAAMTAARERVAQVEQQLAEMETSQNRLADQWSEKEGAWERLKNDLENKTIRAETDKASAQTAFNEQQAEATLFEEKIKRLEDVESKVDAMERALHEARETVGAQENEMKALEAERDEIRAKNTKIQAELYHLRQDAQESPAAGEMEALSASLSAAEKEKDGLAQQLEQERKENVQSALASQLAQALKETETLREQLSLTSESPAPPASSPEPSEPSEPSELAELSEHAEPAEFSEPAELFELAEPAELTELAEPAKASPSGVVEAARVLAAAKKHGNLGKLLLGQLLVEAECITSEQLQRAVEEQGNNPSRHIGALLVENGYCSEEAVAQGLAAQCNVEYVFLEEMDLDPDAATLISERLAEKHNCIPMHATEETLTLAIGNPLDLVAIEDVERATNRRAEIVVATLSDIRNALSRFHWEPE
jgi:hypothetical protein